jgi:hypothetical protein
VLEGNGDGGYRFADASFYAGQIDAATASPLQGNGTAAHPIGEILCDAGEWHLMSGGAYVCGKVSGGSTYTGVSPIYVDASSSSIGIGTVSLEAGVSVTPKLQESRLWPCASTGQGIYNEGTGTMQCGALPLGTSAAVSGLLPIASGGTGAAMTCSGSQLVQASSSTVLTCNTMSGDGTMSAGVLTNSGLENGIVTAGPATGTLTCAQGATACGRAQANTANATPATMLDTPQASTNAAGVGGSYTVNLPNPGTGNYGGWTLEQGGTPVVRLGTPPNPTFSAYNGLWIGPPSASPTVFNMSISQNGSQLQINDPNELDLEYGSGSYAIRILGGNTLSYTGQNFSVNVGSVSTANALAAGGSGVIGIANAMTVPSSTISGGAIVYASGGAFLVSPSGVTTPQFGVSSGSTAVANYLAQSGTVPSTCTAGNYCTGGSTGDLYGRGGGSTVTETHIAPQGDAFSYLDYGTILRTGAIAASGGTGLVTWPVPIGYVCWMHIVAVGNYSSGTAGTASDIYTVYRNSAGTASKVGILGSAANPIQNVGTSGAVADTHFNTASAGPIGTGSTAGSAGSVQITVTNQASSTANAFEVFVDAKCSSG